MKTKYYAVRVGRVPGIYTTWVECEKQVKYFRKAVFKSFKFRCDAEHFIKGTIPRLNTLANYW